MKRAYAFLASLVCLGLAAIWWRGWTELDELIWGTPLQMSTLGWTAGFTYAFLVVLFMVGVFVCLYYALRED